MRPGHRWGPAVRGVLGGTLVGAREGVADPWGVGEEAAVCLAAPGQTPPFPLADGQVAGERGLSASKTLASADAEVEQAPPCLLSLHRQQGTKHFSEYPWPPQKNFVAVSAAIPRGKAAFQGHP